MKEAEDLYYKFRDYMNRLLFECELTDPEDWIYLIDGKKTSLTYYQRFSTRQKAYDHVREAIASKLLGNFYCAGIGEEVIDRYMNDHVIVLQQKNLRYQDRDE